MADEKQNISETNKKISEVKKKIALCEGKRRAVFSVGLCCVNFTSLDNNVKFQLRKRKHQIEKRHSFSKMK